jgi:hypothetical protein
MVKRKFRDSLALCTDHRLAHNKQCVNPFASHRRESDIEVLGRPHLNRYQRHPKTTGCWFDLGELLFAE